MTPVRVRGKRRGTPAEKWHQGKSRQIKAKIIDSSSPALSFDLSSSGLQRGSHGRKRPRIELANIEQLPTEIIQSIFEHSKNLSLPCASPALLAQLSDRHVYEMLTSQILKPVLDSCSSPTGHCDMLSSDVAAASRLLSCKFMTWSFFCNWLQTVSAQIGSEDIPGRDQLSLNFFKTMWSRLGPSPRLLPPRKLLHGPWSNHRASFLNVLALDKASLLADSPILGEVAYEGLFEAIAEAHVYAVETLLDLGVTPTTEMLRRAVVEAGCDKEIVLQLIKASHETGRIDFLDPVLWSWAHRAQANGDERGAWLMALLRRNGGSHHVRRSRIKND
nr:hypothetical protein CFP56_24427 [Quercus suber]